MRRRFIVKWYEYDLTRVMCRKFFTEIAARVYMMWIEYKENVHAKLYTY